MAENALRLSEEQIRDMSLVDLALELLRATNKPHYYRDIMNEIARLRGMSAEEVNGVIARLYTEINMDGRFLCIGNNVWGLKRWYPTEKTSEKSTGAKKFVRKEIDWEDEEEEDVFEEEEEEETLEVEEEDGIYLFGRDKNNEDDDEEPEEEVVADLELTDDTEEEALLGDDDLDEVLADEEEVDPDEEEDDDEDDDEEDLEKDKDGHV
ncbi:MAG: DNA-directed polymerase subunit delta [Bacilli bacterium]|nr:DNA-directed polymerase subunit delta [Bacilli bacterium]